MICSTNIITCLRSIGIEPECSCKEKEPNRPDREPNFAINYSSTNKNYFHSGNNQKEQWWKIDLKRKAALTSIKMEIGKAECHWIKSWEVKTSLDGISYKSIYSSETYTTNQNIGLKNIEYFRYLQIIGASGPTCQYPNKMAIKRVYLYGILQLQTSQVRVNLINFLSFISNVLWIGS